MGGVSATPRPLYPRERRGTHCAGGWVGPQGRSGQLRKISPPPAFDPQTVQLVATALSRPIDTKGNIKICLMRLGPSYYGMEIEVAWVTSQWQAFVTVLLILRVLKTKTGVLYYFLRLQYLSFSSHLIWSEPYLVFISLPTWAVYFFLSSNMNSGYL